MGENLTRITFQRGNRFDDFIYISTYLYTFHILNGHSTTFFTQNLTMNGKFEGKI